MKLKQTYLFITISSVALIVVLIIQVNWILQTAKAKEELFNEKANIILSKTADVLSADKTTFNNLKMSAGKSEVHTIDSIFNHYMKLYNIHIDYFFEVKAYPLAVNNLTGLRNNYSSSQPGSYQTCIVGEPDKNNIELKLVFPKKEQFILAEMGYTFISSVILILIVMIISWRNILSLMKEKRIAAHTTDFINNMTHEFKTPITNIALAGKMIIKDSNIKQQEKIKQYSGIILDENEKLRLQVEQVLSMTELERGEIPLHKTELDFHQLINNSLKCMSLQIENKNGYVKLNLEADKFIIYGDKTHLTNALCNLIDNAIKYSKDQPELIILTANEGSNLILVISDKGIGIDDVYKENIFKKYFRVPTGDVHDVKGFGLGLSYVKRIIVLHDGTIDMQSEKWKGTSFTIKLPYV